MKTCKYCQAYIPKNATVCPNCKRTLTGNGCLLFVLIFIIIAGFGMAITFGLVITLGMNGRVQKEVSGVSNESEYITKKEFEKIETGMTYEEVKQIVGSSGTLSSKVDSGVVVIEIYTWYGNGVAGSNANVTFQDGKVTGKAQVGLK